MMTLLATLGDDRMVVDAARVSFDRQTEADAPLSERDIRLIQYLARHNHITPFFHPQAQFRITAPIFVARQWMRSVIGTARNEVSRRYIDTPPEFYRPQWRHRPDSSIKQGSAGPVSSRLQHDLDTRYNRLLKHALRVYTEMLEDGVAPEQARMALPQSMMTSWIETGSLAYWSRFYKLRSDPHAQAEIQTYAAVLNTTMQAKFPISWEALTC